MLKRAMVMAVLLVIFWTMAAKAQNLETHTNCGDYTEAPVGLFVDKACLPSGAWWPVFKPWEKSLVGEEINDSISSIYVKEGWSVEVAENPDGTGKTACLVETKWDFSVDSWPDGQGGNMDDTISFFQVFEDDACGEKTEPPVEHKFCDSLSFEGVGFYNLPACEWPGESLVVTTTGAITLGTLSGKVSSLYIAQGWSLLASNGDEEICLWGGAKWDLSQDSWSSGQTQDNSFVEARVFDNQLCNEPPMIPKRHLFLPALVR